MHRPQRTSTNFFDNPVLTQSVFQWTTLEKKHMCWGTFSPCWMRSPFQQDGDANLCRWQFWEGERTKNRQEVGVRICKQELYYRCLHSFCPLLVFFYLPLPLHQTYDRTDQEDESLRCRREKESTFSKKKGLLETNDNHYQFNRCSGPQSVLCKCACQPH